MIKYCFALLFFALLAAEEEDLIAKRIYNHLCVEDFQSACQESKLASIKYPHSIPLLKASIKALAASGDEKEMYNYWKKYSEIVPDPFSDRELLEDMGWCIINKGSKSPSPLVRLIAVVGAYFGQDAKGVRIIQRSLHDYDANVRSVALQVSAGLKDDRIKNEVLNLFETEQLWHVKLGCVKAIGKMQIEEAVPQLMKFLETATSYEMRMAAIMAIAEIEENVTREQIKNLISSSKANLKMLACQFVLAFDKIEDIDLLIPLLKDSNAEVRASAIYTVGLLHPSKIGEEEVVALTSSLLEDKNEIVSLLTAWTIIQYDQKLGQKYFSQWLNDKDKNTRIFAATLLRFSGKYAFPLLTEVFNNTKDPFVKANLAMGLIYERNSVDAAFFLKHFMIHHKERLMWKELFHFKSITHSIIPHNAGLPSLPEATDQLLRLEIFNLLAIMKAPFAQELIERYLSERNWGVVAAASSLLLTEGDENSVKLVEDLLEENNPKIKIQAALILSLWGEGEKASKTLMEAYDHSDRNMKEKILEALGHLHCKEVLPFLCDKLSENHPTLRIIAAAALLKSLYN